MNRLLSVIICIVFAATAQADSAIGLKSAFDDFQYSLTVEWDQKDQAAFKAYKAKLASDIIALEKEGVTKEEMLQFISQEAKNSKVSKDMAKIMKTIQIEKMSNEEAIGYITTSIKTSYANGASWNGNVNKNVMITIAVIAGALLIHQLVLKAAYKAAESSAESFEGFPSCWSYLECQLEEMEK